MGADPAQRSAYVAVAAKCSDDWIHLAVRVCEENTEDLADEPQGREVLSVVDPIMMNYGIEYGDAAKSP